MKRIAELPLKPKSPPPVSRNKLQFSLEGHEPCCGWLGCGRAGLEDEVSLVRAANGQVYKVATSEANAIIKSANKSTRHIESRWK